MFTAVIPLGVNCGFSYADELDPTPEELQSAAICTYFNSRNGYFVSSSPVGVVALLKRNIDEFFNSSENHTGITSTSEFVSHISINSNGSFGVIMDQTAINFLDNLTKWLLGKEEFPDLYSGGSWGEGSTNDTVYDGDLYGNSLSYSFTNNNYQLSNNITCIGNPIYLGTTINGQSSEYIKSIFDSQTNFDWSGTNQRYTSINFTIQYNATDSQTLNLTAGGNVVTEMNSYKPFMKFQFTTNNPTGEGEAQYYNSVVYSNNGLLKGNPAYVKIHNPNTGITAFGSGFVTYNSSNDKYYVTMYKRYTSNDGIVPVSINFQTENFDKNDQEDSDPEATTTYIPKYTEDAGNTYNTYNNNNTTSSKQFITKYINNYITKETIIYKDSSDDPNPEQPTNPGGTVPDWGNTGSGDGTITPDGNGGFNLHFPDFNLPDLNIDWSINGLSEKFPFSIPFDLMAFFAVLNAEPETPELAGSIDLGLVQWDIDWDLHDFDNTASILRNLEFIGFCIALILITRKIIKG